MIEHRKTYNDPLWRLQQYLTSQPDGKHSMHNNWIWLTLLPFLPVNPQFPPIRLL
jgi:hypothetical protein